MFWNKNNKEKKTREELDRERRKGLLDELNKNEIIGTLYNEEWDFNDFDYLYKEGWELISAVSSRPYHEILFFKRRGE